MGHFVYFLCSETTGRWYCGETQNLEDRFLRHNSGLSKSTKNGVPWVLKGYVVVEHRGAARILERQVKNRGIQRWFSENGHRVTLEA